MKEQMTFSEYMREFILGEHKNVYGLSVYVDFRLVDYGEIKSGKLDKLPVIRALNVEGNFIIDLLEHYELKA
jgi:hypothetical protein